MRIKAKERWPRWMGIRGFYFVYHGSWSDPEIVWHNHAMNIHDVEDPRWDVYAETCRDEGTTPTNDGFVQFCKDEVERMREYAQMVIDCGNARRIRRVTFESHLFSDDAPCIVAVPA